jgi:hypothetical protein
MSVKIKSRIQVSGFTGVAQIHPLNLWPLKSRVREPGLRSQETGDRVRSQESDVRIQNEEPPLIADCLLLSAFCRLPPAVAKSSLGK